MMAAINALRFRRTLLVFRRALSSAHPPTAISSPSSPSATNFIQPSIFKAQLSSLAQSRPFRSSFALFSSSRSPYDNEKIDPDTILFEGCDYNHWLITMDFPKDPKPTPEEMVRTYEETCARGLGISIEEAKRRMYACSTTTYQGFQAVMTEEESEKFRGLPGVVFILPDSYIDPVNKEYGGDKYENGVITPRPPPFQYRRDGGRFRDRNRNPDQPRYDRQGGQVPSQQGYSQYGQQGRNFGAPQSYPQQQNYGVQGSPGGYSTPQSYGPAGGSQNYPPRQSYGPGASAPQNYGPAGGFQNYPPQQSYGPPGASQNYPQQQSYGPPGASQRFSPQQSYGPPGGRDAYQTDSRDPLSPPHGNYNKGMQGNYHAQERRDFPQGDGRDYVTPSQGYSGMDTSNYTPTHGGSSAQGNIESFGQGMNGAHGEGPSSGYGQNYPGEVQRSPQMEQRNLQGQQTNHVPMGEYRD